MSGNVHLAFGTIFKNLRKSSESDRKSSEIRRKRRHQHVYIMKRTLHVSSKISWQELYLTRSPRSLVRYSSCHSSIKSISSRHRVISSIYLQIHLKITKICAKRPKTYICEMSIGILDRLKRKRET